MTLVSSGPGRRTMLYLVMSRVRSSNLFMRGLSRLLEHLNCSLQLRLRKTWCRSLLGTWVKRVGRTVSCSLPLPWEFFTMLRASGRVEAAVGVPGAAMLLGQFGAGFLFRIVGSCWCDW